MRIVSGLAALLIILISALPTSAPASDIVNGMLRYRGFSVDMTTVPKAADLGALEASLKKQLDIVADVGVKPDVMVFFRKQKIAVKPQSTPGHDNGGASFTPANGIAVNPVPLPPERPVVLHELLHALHTFYLPDGVNNADVNRFYDIAVRTRAYPADEYLMRDKVEFFAVTGSVYLWGFVARMPNNRETLRAKQPRYYEWLGQVFGVKK